MFAHFIKREQSLVLDRLGDRAFAYAVATTDLVRIFHRHGARVSFVAHITNIRFTKHEVVANLVDVFAFTQQFKVPRTINRVAVQTGTNELIVLDHKAFVNTTNRVRERDVFRAFAALKIACAEQVNTGDFKLGRCH